jgi:hypothetical protein
VIFRTPAAFDATLVHSLALVRTPRDSGTPDEWGQPTAGPPAVVDTFYGLIQPLSARELGLVSQAGASVSDHTLFCRPLDIRGGDYVRFEPDDGRRYDVITVPDVGGQADHLECGLRMVQAEARVPGFVS